MKKIILISYIPISREVEKNFYILEFSNSGFAVEFWDISRVYFKNIIFEREIQRNYVKKISTFDEICQGIKSQDIKETVFIPLTGYTGWVWKLFRLFSRFNCRILFYSGGLLPNSVRNKSLLIRLTLNFRYFLKIKNWTNASYNKFALLLKKLKIVKDYDVVFAAGSVAADMYRGKSEILRINYWDYDNYLQIKDNKSRIIDSKYCVFIDDDLIKSSDFLILKIKTIDSEKYYKSLNIFFDFIENKFHIKVIVAVHPRSAYKGGEFMQRETFRHMTNELVKDCEFAIAHCSTSVAYPILYKKPIIFAYTEQMKAQYYFKTIVDFSKILKSSLVNIDSTKDLDALIVEKPNLTLYDEYKYSYLTSKETENKLTKNIIIDYFKK